MTKKLRSQTQSDEIGLLCGTSEVRGLSDKVNKAGYILQNYAGEVQLSARAISKYFGITRDQLCNRVWSILCGYTEHTVKKPRYLAPAHEARLAEILESNHQKNNSSTKDDLFIMVMYL